MPQAIFADNVKDVVADGFTTADKLCTTDELKAAAPSTASAELSTGGGGPCGSHPHVPRCGFPTVAAAMTS